MHMARATAQNPTQRSWWDPSVEAEWIADYLPAGNRSSAVLNVGCGNGRHARSAISLGYKVFAVDDEVSGVLNLATGGPAIIMQADVENKPWPFPEQYFAAGIVAKPLPKKVLEAACRSVEPGGYLFFDLFSTALAVRGDWAEVDGPFHPGPILSCLGGGFEILASENAIVTYPKVGVALRVAARKMCEPAELGLANQDIRQRSFG